MARTLDPSRSSPSGSLQPPHTSRNPQLPTHLSTHPTHSHPTPMVTPTPELCHAPSPCVILMLFPMHWHPLGALIHGHTLCPAFSTPSLAPAQHSVYAFIAALISGHHLSSWASDVPTGPCTSPRLAGCLSHNRCSNKHLWIEHQRWKSLIQAVILHTNHRVIAKNASVEEKKL